MSSFKESHTSRPHIQHRTSMNSATSANIPIRNSTSRNHSHSVSLGTINPAHRVTRRKSMTSTAINNVAAIAAAMNSGSEHLAGASHTNRRSLPSKVSGSSRTLESTSVGRGVGFGGGHDTMIMDSATDPEFALSRDNVQEGSAIAEGLAPLHTEANHSKSRNRRASEGAPLSKSEGKRVSGELRCEKCGKGYKHSSCLTKHLWEHTPEWSYTSKLLISKHQQVQLLEAASVLVGMNQDTPDTPGSMKVHDSDHSSASPAASGISDLQDGYLSSTETTPPPMGEHTFTQDSFSTVREKRNSASSSIFSRSYQSASSMPAGSIPLGGSGFGQFHHTSSQRRPSTSGVGAQRRLSIDEEEAGLAAAVESLCSFGTPRSGAVQLPPDIPPVPPLPARFASQNLNKMPGNGMYMTVQPSLDLPPPSFQRLSNERDPLVKASRKSDLTEDDEHDEHMASRGRHDEDDDEIMFGRDEAIF